MTRSEEAYIDGMGLELERHGFDKKASYEIATRASSLIKSASLFNFSDSPYGGGGEGLTLSKVLVPLLAAAGTGYITYNAAMEGSKSRSAFDNIKNYIGGKLDKVMRRDKPRPFFDFSQYLDRTSSMG